MHAATPATASGDALLPNRSDISACNGSIRKNERSAAMKSCMVELHPYSRSPPKPVQNGPQSCMAVRASRRRLQQVPWDREAHVALIQAAHLRPHGQAPASSSGDQAVDRSAGCGGREPGPSPSPVTRMPTEDQALEGALSESMRLGGTIQASVIVPERTVPSDPLSLTVIVVSDVASNVRSPLFTGVTDARGLIVSPRVTDRSPA
jgi:hypothetical protein